jgi:hypothetical protein
MPPVLIEHARWQFVPYTVRRKTRIAAFYCVIFCTTAVLTARSRAAD